MISRHGDIKILESRSHTCGFTSYAYSLIASNISLGDDELVRTSMEHRMLHKQNNILTNCNVYQLNSSTSLRNAVRFKNISPSFMEL